MAIDCTILRELSYLNIIYNVIQNGKQYDLQVDQEQLNEAKNILAIKGMHLKKQLAMKYLMKHLIWELQNLISDSFGSSIIGEMEKAIMEFDAIDYAHVKLLFLKQNYLLLPSRR